MELDPDLGEAHAALAGILFLFEWDWAGADAEYRRGIALSPGSETVHEDYGSYLNAIGRLNEGLVQSREAARLDPLSLQLFHDIAINARYSRAMDDLPPARHPWSPLPVERALEPLAVEAAADGKAQ